MVPVSGAYVMQSGTEFFWTSVLGISKVQRRAIVLSTWLNAVGSETYSFVELIIHVSWDMSDSLLRERTACYSG